VYVIDCAWHDGGDQVTSLAGIQRLASVHTIDLTGQDVRDLHPLAALPDLTSLRLTGNGRVGDLTPLTGLPLTNLGLSDTGVTDLAPLSRTTTLQWVGLSDTGVSDLGPLASSAGLIELDVAYAAVTDLSPLAGAASLSMLDVRANQVTDVTPVASMPALDELWVGGNPVADLRPLLDAPALLGVDIEGLDPGTPGVEELRAQGVYVGGLA
jgi:Leucine-rich repeat (LRR) protein